MNLYLKHHFFFKFHQVCLGIKALSLATSRKYSSACYLVNRIWLQTARCFCSSYRFACITRRSTKCFDVQSPNWIDPTKVALIRIPFANWSISTSQLKSELVSVLQALVQFFSHQNSIHSNRNAFLSKNAEIEKWNFKRFISVGFMSRPKFTTILSWFSSAAAWLICRAHCFKWIW